MRYYFRYRRIVDFAFALSLTLLVFHAPDAIQIFIHVSADTRQNLALSMIGTGSSLLGFILAASTFLISHIQDQRFELLRSSKSFYQLHEIISSSLWRLLALTVGSGLLLFTNDQHLLLFLMTLHFLIVWSLAALSVTIWTVLRIYAIPVGSHRHKLSGHEAQH